MSLLSRTTSPNPNSTPGRFNNTSNQNSSNRFKRGSSPFGKNNDDEKEEDPNTYITNVIVPVHREVMRFGLIGLGDPFYRILGHSMNPELGDIKSLVKHLEAGGEAIEILAARLDEHWASYNLTGAMMMFRYTDNTEKILTKPTPYANQNDADKPNDDDNPNPDASITRLRATDPSLTLNVLARSRSQVLLTEAPLIFASDYLFRALYTDDPRLVALGKVTGCVPDA
jgi:hypothetical protein